MDNTNQNNQEQDKTINWNHDAKTKSESFGVTPERAEELMDLTKAEVIKLKDDPSGGFSLSNLVAVSLPMCKTYQEEIFVTAMTGAQFERTMSIMDKMMSGQGEGLAGLMKMLGK